METTSSRGNKIRNKNVFKLTSDPADGLILYARSDGSFKKQTLIIKKKKEQKTAGSLTFKSLLNLYLIYKHCLRVIK